MFLFGYFIILKGNIKIVKFLNVKGVVVILRLEINCFILKIFIIMKEKKKLFIIKIDYLKFF